MRRANHAWLFLAAAACVSAFARPARASELRLRSDGDCVAKEDVAQQVDTLLGRPLAGVEGVDFEVEIARDAGERWRLRIDAVDPQQQRRRTRELSAGTCAELGDAAAVAIAMSIQGSAQAETPRPAPAVATPTPEPTAPPPTATAVAAPTAAAPARGALTLALVVDAGALPNVGPGAALEGAVAWRHFRVVAGGALFFSQEAMSSTGRGGDFQLVTGMLLACLTDGLGRVTLLGCAGGEIGRLSAEGTGPGITVSRLGHALWLAGRLEIGAVYPLSPRLALMLRGGLVVPGRRPVFVLDETMTVHQPANLTARATLGVEVGF